MNTQVGIHVRSAVLNPSPQRQGPFHFVRLEPGQLLENLGDLCLMAVAISIPRRAPCQC